MLALSNIHPICDPLEVIWVGVGDGAANTELQDLHDIEQQQDVQEDSP